MTVPLLVHTGRRGAINRTTWNTKAWKPALADVGVIPPLPERQPGEKPSRVWEPSREHGFHVLRRTCASVMLEAGESIVSLAKWLGHSDPAFTLRTYTRSAGLLMLAVDGEAYAIGYDQGFRLVPDRVRTGGSD
ncbi:tyrosine-type recombinase/integrase [Streptomyces sp. NPDC056352]|uniref:tyrosine-type recombinase/integrase n=1 Tax=Streptomyces sp. NPDC056352 TaxID=3345791 RepID=UPI0035D5D31B